MTRRKNACALFALGVLIACGYVGGLALAVALAGCGVSAATLAQQQTLALFWQEQALCVEAADARPQADLCTDAVRARYCTGNGALADAGECAPEGGLVK